MPLVITASRFDFPQLGFELTFQLGHSRSAFFVFPYVL